MGFTRGDARAFGRWSRRMTRREAPARVQAMHQKIHVQLSDGVIADTPVGNPDLWASPPPKGYAGGRARGSWVSSIGVATPRPTSIDPNGGATQQAGQAVALAIPAFSRSQIASFIAYIQRLNDGWSTQQPADFVQRNIQRVRAQFSRAARR